MKAFQSRDKVSESQSGIVQTHIVDRAPGAPKSQERVYVDNMECLVISCQPAGKDAFRLIVRKA